MSTPAGLAAALRGMVAEVLAIVREMLRIPAAIYMRVAELVGGVVLTAWLFVWPLLVAAWRLARLGLAVAQREVTPARATVVVSAAAAILLAVSQFVDYRSVAIGSDQYGPVEKIAPPPEVDATRAGSTHAWVGLPLALAALGALAAAVGGRWRAAMLLAPIGLVTVAVSLLIDVPKGLDEGDAAVAFEGASAGLRGGFWVQLTCGVLLIALAPLVTRALRPGGRRSAATPRRPRPPVPRVPAREAGA